MAETVLGIALVLTFVVLLWVIRQNQRERENSWSHWASGAPSNSHAKQKKKSKRDSSRPSDRPPPSDRPSSPAPPQPTGAWPNQYHVSYPESHYDSIRVTSMTKHQLDEYLTKEEPKPYTPEEMERLASLDPENVIYIDDKKWFDPALCHSYPSRSLGEEELLMTNKGTWIIKNIMEDSFEIVDKRVALVYLERNGYDILAAQLIPLDSENEL